MHTRLGLTDGRIITSDEFPRSEIQAHIDNAGGVIGTEDYASVRVEDVDDAIAFITQMWQRMTNDSEATFTIIVNGEDAEFSGDTVAWFRFVED